MSDRKGFTLIEIIAVAVILGILATIAVINYTPMMTQQAAQAAQNNLISIYNAEKTYYLNSTTGGSYYISASCPSNDITNINANLNLNIADAQFTYCCTNTGGFTCTATNIQDGNLSLSVTNASIVLPGGSTCASPTSLGCNPSCASDVASYCPSTSV